MFIDSQDLPENRLHDVFDRLISAFTDHQTEPRSKSLPAELRDAPQWLREDLGIGPDAGKSGHEPLTNASSAQPHIARVRRPIG